MSEVFILGAGFSRAISDEMPLTKDLSKEVVDRYLHAGNISLEVRRMIEEDFEKALTFLTQDKPWLTEAENRRHKALYLDLTHVIRGILTEKSRSASVWGINNPPLWLEALITYWHINQCTVITLNYDTLIERVASSVNWAQRTNPIPTGTLSNSLHSCWPAWNDYRCLYSLGDLQTFQTSWFDQLVLLRSLTVFR